MTSRTWLLLLLCLLAFAVRCFALDRRPLHFDEGNNVYFARNALDLLALSIANAEADPPLHRALLGIWMLPAGPTPTAIRLLSVFFGVLAVALMWPLARALRLPPQPTLVMMGLLVLSAFHIDYSQEAKGYALVSAAATASWIAWLRLQRPRMAALYVAASLAAIATHYFVAPLFAMQWLRWLFVERPMLSSNGRIKAFARRAGLQAMVAAPIALWIVLAWRGILAGGAKAVAEVHAVNPLLLIANIFGEMVLGRHVDEITLSWAGAAMIGLLAIACAALWRDHHRAFWFSASLLVPLAFALAIAPRLSIFHPRFLLWTLPNLLLAVAMIFVRLIAGHRSSLRQDRAGEGRVALSRKSEQSGGGLGGAIVPAIPALAAAIILPGYYSQPLDVPNDFRPLIARLAPLVRNGDVAYGTYIWMDGMFASYAPQLENHMEWVRDFYSQDGGDIGAVMTPAARAPRVWHMNFLRSPDAPATLSAQWLKRNGAEALRDTDGNLTALLFAVNLPARELGPETPLGDDVRLRHAPLPRALVHGDVLTLDLQWTTSQALQDLAVFVHLVGPDGALVDQRDGDLQNGLVPAFAWPVQTGIADRRAFVMLPGYPSGTYEVRVGMYSRATGLRVRVLRDLDYLSLGKVELR